MCNPLKANHRGIAAPLLDLANIRPIKIGTASEFFLR